MENKILKIQKFSKVVYILLVIAFVGSIIAAVVFAVSWIWTLLQLHTEIITTDSGITIEAPILFKVGDTQVVLPFINYADTEPGAFGMDYWLGCLIESIVTLAAVIAAMRIFNLLRHDGNPFREGVVRSLKHLAIALLVVGIFTGAVGFIGAAVVGVLCLIFDYGCALQRESDTTL